MKKVLWGTALSILGTLAAVYVGLLYVNNAGMQPPDQARIRKSFAAGVEWLESNRQDILSQDNVALWWMVQQSAERTRDPALLSLFEDYRTRHLKRSRNVWKALFYPGHWVPTGGHYLEHLKDYQLQFVYAINCDPDLAAQSLVQAQLNADYCDQFPFRPACATHQLIAFRFMQRAECGDAETTQAAIRKLQARLVRQLTWDPRVVDVYLQRVLMLVESGARESVKPVWLHRILDAQRSDGGWSPIDVPVSLGDGAVSLGFDARGLTRKGPYSTFHTTAQGVFLMGLLLQTP